MHTAARYSTRGESHSAYKTSRHLSGRPLGSKTGFPNSKNDIAHSHRAMVSVQAWRIRDCAPTILVLRPLSFLFKMREALIYLAHFLECRPVSFVGPLFGRSPLRLHSLSSAFIEYIAHRQGPTVSGADECLNKLGFDRAPSRKIDDWGRTQFVDLHNPTSLNSSDSIRSIRTSTSIDEA